MIYISYNKPTIDFEQRLIEIYGNSVPFYECTEFLSINKPMSAKCKKCHNVTNSNARKFIRPDIPFKCGYCSGMVRNTEIVKKEIFDLVGDEYELLSEYVGAHKPMTLYHKICDNRFEVSKNKFVTKNQRCTHCSASVGEQLIQNYLNRNKIHHFFDRKYQGNLECLNVKGGSLRFDFQILNSEGIICAIIEFDGNQHYQDVKYFNQTYEESQKTDRIKNDFCSDNNIPLLRIPISEVLRRQNTKLTSSNISIDILHTKIDIFLSEINQNFKLSNKLLDEIFLENKNRIAQEIINKELTLLLEDTSLTWKDVPDFENIYKISNNGNIVRLNYRLEPIRLLKPESKARNLIVGLSNKRKNTYFVLPKLVYSVFNNIPYGKTKGYRVLIIDGNKMNVNINNIRLLNKEEQLSEFRTSNKKSVCRINIETNEKKVYYPITAVRLDGFDNSSVGKCCKGKLKSYKGYRWEYIEDAK